MSDDCGLMWFRRDLRLSDNPAWAAATSKHRAVITLYVLDHRLLSAAGPHRRRQFVADLHALDDSLRDRGGRLLVRHGDPAVLVPREVARSRARRAFWNADVTPFAARRDAAVTDALAVESLTPTAIWSCCGTTTRSTTSSSASWRPRWTSRRSAHWATQATVEGSPGGRRPIVLGEVDGERGPEPRGRPCEPHRHDLQTPAVDRQPGRRTWRRAARLARRAPHPRRRRGGRAAPSTRSTVELLRAWNACSPTPARRRRRGRPSTAAATPASRSSSPTTRRWPGPARRAR